MVAPKNHPRPSNPPRCRNGWTNWSGGWVEGRVDPPRWIAGQVPDGGDDMQSGSFYECQGVKTVAAARAVPSAADERARRVVEIELAWRFEYADAEGSSVPSGLEVLTAVCRRGGRLRRGGGPMRPA